MDIDRTSKDQDSNDGESVPPPPPKPTVLKAGGIAPIPPSQENREDPHAIVSDLCCFSAGLSALIYRYDFVGLRRILTLEGATHFAIFTTLNSGIDLPGADHYSKIAIGFHFQGRAWLVFRGSDDAYDWDTNFRFLKTKEHIHSGFHTSWLGLREKVMLWVENHAAASENLVITGHSLGGAMGILAAKELAEKKICHIEAVLTFGAPRVGSAHFVEQYNNTMIVASDGSSTNLREITYQVRIHNDLVPKVPPAFLGFAHCGKEIIPPSDYSPRVDQDTALELELLQAKKARPLAPEFPSPQNTLKDILEPFLVTFHTLFPLNRIFFDAADKAMQGGMSHRMVRYQNFFGQYLSFQLAIDRDDSVLASIQDNQFPDEKQETPSLSAMFDGTISKKRFEREFRVEKVRGWTPLLSIVGVLALLLLFLCCLATVFYVTAELRVFAAVLLGVGSVSFILKIIEEINGK